MLIYTSAAKGFKSGGYNGINIFSFQDAQKSYFPESNWTYEAGIKTDMLGNSLRVNANYYYAKISDLALNALVTLPNGTTAFPVQNAGKATIQGLEYEITVVPTDNLTLFLSGTALSDGKYTFLRAGSAPANALRDYGVNPSPPQVPDYSYNAGFEYGVDVGSFGYLNNYMTLGAKSGIFEYMLFASDVRGDGHLDWSKFNTQTVNFLGTWTTPDDKVTVKVIHNHVDTDATMRHQ